MTFTTLIKTTRNRLLGLARQLGPLAPTLIRLTLGVMLEVGPEGPERLPADHPLAVHFDVYQWLTVLQEYLVLALMRKPAG